MGCGASKSPSSAAAGVNAEPRKPETLPETEAASLASTQAAAHAAGHTGADPMPDEAPAIAAEPATQLGEDAKEAGAPDIDDACVTGQPEPNDSAGGHTGSDEPAAEALAAQEEAPAAQAPPATENPLPAAEEPLAEQEPLYEPFAKFIAVGRAGDAQYRQLRVKARYEEPVKPPGLPSEEEAELKRVWQEEWNSFPRWEYVLLARGAVGKPRWGGMSSDRKRAACERFLLCGPWAATQEPDAEQLARLRAISSSARFVLLGHPARRDTATGAFCAAHGLASTTMLKSDRPHNPSYYDQHNTTTLGETLKTAEVCHKIIVPATRAFGASYVDLYLGPELWDTADPQSGDTPEKGYFLSHAWGMPFMELVTAAIHDGAPPAHDNGPYWIDIFCKNQHVPIQESDLTDNILRSKTVLLAVHPWPKPLLTTRVWCLFEILTAVQTQVDLQLKFCASAAWGLKDNITKSYNQFNFSNVYSDVMKNGLSSVMPGAGEVVEAIDVEQAEATVASDRDMIMRLINEGVGVEEMNKLVREMLVKGLANAAHDVLQADIGQDRLAYNSYEGGWD